MSAYLFNVLLTSGILLLSEIGVLSDSSAISDIEKFISYIKETAKDVSDEKDDPPQNKNSSIRYLLYTPSKPTEACYLEPTKESLESCQFVRNIPVNILIHGFSTDLQPGNSFEMIKNSILKTDPTNVIIVDWTEYNKPPYQLAVNNTFIVGQKLIDLIDFLKIQLGVDTQTFYLIGHSLGAHMAGFVGKKINLGRITGLDPAGLSFDIPLNRLTFTDATFVDIINTSNEKNGFGLSQPIGDSNFYVNGGKKQPLCRKGNSYINGGGPPQIIKSSLDKMECNHHLSINYFLQSINNTDCRFVGTLCKSYRDFEQERCADGNGTNTVTVMGYYDKKSPAVPPQSKFYLKTRDRSPFCIKYTSH